MERLEAPPHTLHTEAARWLDFRRSRKTDSPQPAFGLTLWFAEPVMAPFSLGYASHYGLGTFIPTASDSSLGDVDP